MAVVWQLSIRHLSSGSLVRGTLLKSTPVLLNIEPSPLRNMAIVLGSYWKRVLADTPILLKIDGQDIETKTNNKGEFVAGIDFHAIEIDGIYQINGMEKLEMWNEYPYLFEENEGPYEVISDIDDTIMMSYTADTIKRIVTLLFTSPQNRSRIDYTHVLFQSLFEAGARVTYVSKSESNLLGLITAFIKFNNFPLGEIYLTPYLRFREMLFLKKKRSYKEEIIEDIISNSKKKFVLIGDDSQGDILVYTKVAKKFTNQIEGVYIRQTKGSMSSKAKKYIEDLRETGVHLVVFNNTETFKQ